MRRFYHAALLAAYLLAFAGPVICDLHADEHALDSPPHAHSLFAVAAAVHMEHAGAATDRASFSSTDDCAPAAQPVAVITGKAWTLPAPLAPAPWLSVEALAVTAPDAGTLRWPVNHFAKSRFPLTCLASAVLRI